jgi:hypothetical protein
VNLVILDALDPDWLKRPQADMEGDVDGFDSALADAVEDFRGEVETGGRSCNGAALLSIDGLVALAVAESGREM